MKIKVIVHSITFLNKFIVFLVRTQNIKKYFYFYKYRRGSISMFNEFSLYKHWNQPLLVYLLVSVTDFHYMTIIYLYMHYDVHYSRHDRMFNVVENKYSNVMGKTHDDSFRSDWCL